MPLLGSPQAALPTYPGLADQLKPNVAQKASIAPPRIITLSGNAGDYAFDSRPINSTGAGADENNGGVFQDRKPVSKLILHNLGTNPVYYGLNTACDDKDGTYHDILAGGTAAKDGLGSLVNLSLDQPSWVTLKGTAGDKVAVVLSYPLDVNL